MKQKFFNQQQQNKNKKGNNAVRFWRLTNLSIWQVEK
jgi:hypothetical protein